MFSSIKPTDFILCRDVKTRWNLKICLFNFPNSPQEYLLKLFASQISHSEIFYPTLVSYFLSYKQMKAEEKE